MTYPTIPIPRTMGEYIDGYSQLVIVHDKAACRDEHCVVHNPSDHTMSEFPTYWRYDRGLMERICPHGVGHPDPDHIAFVKKIGGVEAALTECVHGCDGCCADAYKEVFKV